MKKTLLVVLLVISMLTMVGFAPVEASYWEDVKEIYEWKAIEGESEIEFNLAIPDENYNYKVNINSKSNLEDFSSYVELKIEDLQGLQSIPTIKMYTHGADLYINKEAILSLLSAIGMGEDIEIEEEYVVIESSQNNVNVNPNMLNDMVEIIDNMDLGIDLGMEKKGNTYTLTLESDKLIDLLDAYLRYVIENMDQFTNLMQQEIMLTEIEKEEVLEAYNTFVESYKEMAKAFIAGSKYHQESTFGKDEYKQKMELVIVTPVGQLDMKSASTSVKLTSSNIKLPTSVMRITEQELTELMMGQIVTGGTGLNAVMELDGSYLKFGEFGLEDGKIELKVEDGKSYITAEDVHKLLDVELDFEGYLHIRELEDYGFNVQWNGENRTIEIYK